MLNYDKIKKVFCDISVSNEIGFACYAIRCYDSDNNLVDKYSGIFEQFDGRSNTAQCEIMVTLLVMETMPSGWTGSIYTDHGGVLKVWEYKEKEKVLTSLVPDKEVRTRFHSAYKNVFASLVKLDSVHLRDIDRGESNNSKPKKMWNEVKIEQVFHLDCDRDCATILSDYKKWSKFICLEEQ